MPPYFINPLLDELEQTQDPERRQQLRLRIAANIGDPSTLRDLFGSDSEDLSHFYPDARSAHPSTTDTIDSFLGKYGSNLPDPDAPLIPEAPAIDYAATFLADTMETTPSITMETTLPSVVENDQDTMETTPPGIVKEGVTKAAADPQNTTLSESFARIMVQNGNYSKALEIFTQLNLNNPEKSIYFADQIRFLKKLIINQSKKR